MRTIVSMVVVLFLATAAARAEVVFTQPVIDLGNLRTGQSLERTLTYQNRGPSPVELLEVMGSCACLLPEFAPRSLTAGQSATMRVKVNSLSAPPGQQNWRLTLRYRERGEVKGVSVDVRAMVIQEIVVQPPEIMVFGNSPTRHEIHVIDVRSKPMHVVKVEASSPYFQAAVNPERRDEAGRVVRPISLEIGANLPPGRHDEQLTIYTDDPQYRELRVSVTAVRRARQRYSATPPAVALYVAAGETTVSRAVVIRDQQGQPIVIDQVTAEDPAITCEWPKEPSSVGTIKVTVHCDQVKSLQFESKVHIRFRSGETLTVPVTCEAR